VQRLSPTKLTDARSAAGLTREQVAVAVGRSFASIAGYERGRILPPADVLARMADLYDVGVGTLFTMEDDATSVAS